MRSALLPILAAAVLCGCVTTPPGTESEASGEAGTAHVIFGREVRAQGLEAYRSRMQEESVWTTEIGIRQIQSGPELIFRKYDPAEGTVPRAWRYGDRERSLSVDLRFDVLDKRAEITPAMMVMSLGTLAGAAGTFNDYNSPEARTDTGYIVYDLYEIPAGDWVFERMILKTIMFPGARGKITRKHHLQFKKGEIPDKALTFHVAPGETVYLGDVVGKFSIEEKNDRRLIYAEDYETNPKYSDNYYYVASPFKYTFEFHPDRMKERLAGKADLSTVQYRFIRRK